VTPEPSADPRWLLVRRVLASATFARSRRVRDLFVYLCERTLRDPAAELNDAEIAVAVLDKEEGAADAGALTRAHASQLRKKLQQYFATEGADEATVIELKTGTYVPAFRAREPHDSEAAEPSIEVPRGRWWPTALLCGVALGSGLLAGTVLTRRAASESRPALNALWRQMFDNGLRTRVVLADANITLFQDLIGQALSVADFERGHLNALVDERISDPEQRRHALRALSQRHTPMADVALSGRILLLHARHGLDADVMLARDATPRHLEGHNTVLSGPRRANPWIDLFEPRLNFRSRFDEASRHAHFENVAPEPGEPPTYTVQYGVRGFCRVAYLPSLDGRGSVLIVSGTDMTSTEVGTEFITSEHWVERLRTRLRVGPHDRLPYFEVLLGSALVVNSASTPELIAHRVVPERP
jgi:hypothetical protein